ncbi:hypothetical protein [Cellulomonas sp. NS3]|uniref:hypothetical protein n=1 Tax=Cellulomonas sp. NS3 TaxID=2973977 RepID=UPI002163C5D8|nr:hypothetical protein [Cellulomonas sp. NS3]
MSTPVGPAADGPEARDAVLRRLADVARQRPLTVVVEAPGGTGPHAARDALLEAVAATGVRVVPVRGQAARADDGAARTEPAAAHGATPAEPAAAHGATPPAVEVLRAAVREHAADVGLALGPTVSTLTVLDENGDPVDEDVVAVLVALQVVTQELAAGRVPTVLHDVLASRVLLDLGGGAGAGLVRVPVGRAVLAEGLEASGATLGVGRGGRFAFRDPAGDDPGLLAGLHVLVALGEQPHPASLLAELYQPYASTGLLAVEVDDVAAAVERVRHAYVTLSGAGPVTADELDGLAVSHWGATPQWWLAVRPSGSPREVQLLVEAADEDIRDKVRDDVLALLREDG